MEVKMKLCRKCNVYYEDEELSFCPTCGTALEEANICPKCNTINELDFMFCSKCGTPLKNNGVNKAVSTNNVISGSQPVMTTQPVAPQEANKSKLKYYIGGLLLVIIAVLALNYDSIKLFMDYNDATNAFNNKNYAVAAEKFKALGSYKDSIDMHNESLYQGAREKYDKKDFIEAEKTYRSLMDTNYKDSYSMWLSSMVAYIDSHMSNTDFTTSNYMDELKDKSPKYFDWNAKYKALYSWRIKVLNVNQSEDDYSPNDNRSYINGSNSPTYVHFELEGGKILDSTKISYRMYNRGYEDLEHYDFKSMNGSKLWLSFWNYYGDINIVFYDGNGNNIGEVRLQAR